MTPKDPDAFKVAQGDAKSKRVRESRGYGVSRPETALDECVSGILERCVCHHVAHPRRELRRSARQPVFLELHIGLIGRMSTPRESTNRAHADALLRL